MLRSVCPALHLQVRRLHYPQQDRHAGCQHTHQPLCDRRLAQPAGSGRWVGGPGGRGAVRAVWWTSSSRGACFAYLSAVMCAIAGTRAGPGSGLQGIAAHQPSKPSALPLSRWLPPCRSSPANTARSQLIRWACQLFIGPVLPHSHAGHHCTAATASVRMPAHSTGA